MTGNKNKRKYFFQKQISLYKSIFSFLLLIGIGTALLSGIYTFFSIKLITYFMGHEGALDPSVSIPLLSRILGSYWFYIITGAALLICLATIFTHRFAGPIYRFEDSLDRMIHNDIYFQIHLRKNDEGKQLAEKINHFNAMLASTIKSIAFLSDEMDKNHLILRKELKQENSTLEQAISLNRKIGKTISEYKYE
jgi:methyl-accepting chemotaxis protein